MILRVIILLLLTVTTVIAQTNPRLQWDQSAASVTEATSYQYELWINGTGQLPLRTAKCTGATSPFVCTDSQPIPNQPEGIRNFQLLAITPQGIKSVLSSNFPITFPSGPTNLRLVP
jgi:hypothetical protein